jgi:hypothetical protein
MFLWSTRAILYQGVIVCQYIFIVIRYANTSGSGLRSEERCREHVGQALRYYDSLLRELAAENRNTTGFSKGGEPFRRVPRPARR